MKRTSLTRGKFHVKACTQRFSTIKIMRRTAENYDLEVNGTTSEKSSENKYKKFRKFNRQIAAWLSGDLFKWFDEYLDKYNYCESFSDKFRLFSHES